MEDYISFKYIISSVGFPTHLMVCVSVMAHGWLLCFPSIWHTLWREDATLRIDHKNFQTLMSLFLDLEGGEKITLLPKNIFMLYLSYLLCFVILALSSLPHYTE